MTLIIGARCTDGVVLVADRKVVGSNRLVDKIRKPDNVNVVFTAGGFERVFEDYLDDLSRDVNWMYNWFQEDNKKQPTSLQRNYDTHQFKKTCITTLTELKKVYSNLGENVSFENILQVFFTLPEERNGQPITRLYKMDMEDCYPEVVEEGKIETIGYSQLASPFLKSLENDPNLKMKDVARVGSFAIKYIENANLTDESVGVGDQEPQIFFVPDENEPKEVKDEKEIKELLNGVNQEVEKIKNMIGSTTFLRS